MNNIYLSHAGNSESNSIIDGIKKTFGEGYSFVSGGSLHKTNYENCIDIKNKILESNFIIIIDSDEYRERFLKGEIGGIYNHKYYEFYIIKNIPEISYNHKYIISEFDRRKVIGFYKNNKVYSESEISMLKKDVETEVIHKERKYDKILVDFVNRKTEINKLKSIIAYESSSQSPQVVKLIGVSQVGKSTFVRKALRKIKKVDLDSLSNMPPIKEFFIDYDPFTFSSEDRLEAYIFKKILKKENNDKHTSREFNYVLILESIEDSAKYTNDIDLMMNVYLNLYREIKKTNSSSNISLILVSRKDIRLSSSKYFHVSISEIVLNPLLRENVNVAIENYIHSNGVKKSKDLPQITKSVWKYTKGLPGALSYMIPIVVGGYIDNYYKITNIKDDVYNPSIHRYFEGYIKGKIITSSCFFRMEKVRDVEIESLLKEVLPYRFLWKNTLQLVTKKINNSAITPQLIEYILGDCCLINHGESSYLRYSLVEFDSSIREMLLIYFFPEKKQRIQLHSEVKEWYLDQGGQLAFSDTYFWEVIWHTLEVQRLVESSSEVIEFEVLKAIESFIGKIDDNDSKGLILSKINHAYNMKPQYIYEISEALAYLNLNDDFIADKLRGFY